MPARKPRVRSEKRTVTEKRWAWTGHDGRPFQYFGDRGQSRRDLQQEVAKRFGDPLKEWPLRFFKQVTLTYPLPRGD